MARVEQILVGSASAEARDGSVAASCSVSLVWDGPRRILFDTASPWQTQQLRKALEQHLMTAEEITDVVTSHGHIDHMGNLNLFPKAAFYADSDVARQDRRFASINWDLNDSYSLSRNVEVVRTPGHTAHCVSLLVRSHSADEAAEPLRVLIAGDLFECHADLADPAIWEVNSHNRDQQQENRERMLALCDVVVPGHGPLFRCPKRQLF